MTVSLFPAQILLWRLSNVEGHTSCLQIPDPDQLLYDLSYTMLFQAEHQQMHNYFPLESLSLCPLGHPSLWVTKHTNTISTLQDESISLVRGCMGINSRLNISKASYAGESSRFLRPAKSIN